MGNVDTRARELAMALQPSSTIGDRPLSSKTLIDTFAPGLSESGNPVVCHPVASYPLGITAHWQPQQSGSGAPSPDNIRPIAGRDAVTVKRCGLNLFDCPATLDFTGTIGYDVHLPAGKYYISTGTVTSDGQQPPNIALNYTPNDNVSSTPLVTNKTVSLSPNRDIHKIYLYANGYNYNNSRGVSATINNLMMTAAAEPDKYQSYTGQTTTLQLPQTIYGGKVDAVTGAGLQTWAVKTLTDMPLYALNMRPNTGKNFVSAHWIWASPDFNGKNNQTDVKCNALSVILWDKIVNAASIDKPMLWTANTSFGVAIPKNTIGLTNDSSGADALTAIQQYINDLPTPMQIAYELNKPIPFTAAGAQPISALQGVNTLLTDADTLTVTGKSDPVHLIKSMQDAVASIQEV